MKGDKQWILDISKNVTEIDHEEPCDSDLSSKVRLLAKPVNQ